MTKKSFLFIIIMIFHILSFSQTKINTKNIENLFEAKEKHEHFDWAKKENTNEIKQIFAYSFLFYKKFLSSQDAARCNFEPSCSVYALQSIKKEGIFIGFLSSLDRLSRCSQFARGKYPKYKNTRLLHDPVK